MRLAFSGIKLDCQIQAYEKNKQNSFDSSFGKEIKKTLSESVNAPCGSVNISLGIPSFIRIANENDKKALKRFHKSVFSKDEASSDIYVDFALKASRTYIIDISEEDSFVVSALSVVQTKNGEKRLMLGGTIPSLRNRGLFSELLLEVESREKREYGGFSALFIPKDEKTFLFMKKRGFSNEVFGLECALRGNNKKKNLFLCGNYAGADYKLCESFYLEDSGISVEAFSVIYQYFAARGGIFGKTGDGYVAFVSANDDIKEKWSYGKNSDDAFEKSFDFSDLIGKYIIFECVLSVKEIKKLSGAFQSCVLPLSKKDELEKAKISYETVITAQANFQTEDRFINGVQRFF